MIQYKGRGLLTETAQGTSIQIPKYQIDISPTPKSQKRLSDMKFFRFVMNAAN